MSEFTPSGSPRPRRRRADAERSITAILDAAAEVLGRHHEAGMEEIATAAGISRQTVYAHSRRGMHWSGRLLDRVTRSVVAALDAADLDDGPVMEALMRLLRISWDTFAGEPFLLGLGRRTTGAVAPEHRQEFGARSIRARLEELFRRGQAEGELDANLPVHWMLGATLALSRAAGEEVRTGRVGSAEALALLEQAATRAFRP